MNARDGHLKCKCGNIPYDNGNPCPKCWAWIQVCNLEEEIRKDKKGKLLMLKDEPKWLKRSRQFALKRLAKKPTRPN